jgi:hypothetical protein
VWKCLLCFALCAQASEKSQQPFIEVRAVEKKLRKYLTKRVLVFRKGDIDRHHVRFDSRGHLATESGLEFKSRPNEILFGELKLGPEHIVISGEAIRVRSSASQPVLSRHPREFRLVTCTLILDVPLDEMTFTRAIDLLCRVFLTREEFHQRQMKSADTLIGGRVITCLFEEPSEETSPTEP